EVSAKLTKTGKPRLPKGWKRVGGDVMSPEAFRSAFRLSAVIVPIVSPVVGSESPEALREGWKALREALKASWARSTELANWCNQRLLSNDATRDPETGKLPPMPSIYLY